MTLDMSFSNLFGGNPWDKKMIPMGCDIKYISNELSLEDAWSELSTAISEEKPIIIINHSELAPACDAWESVGTVMRFDTIFKSLGSIFSSIGVWDSPNLAVPFAITSLLSNGIYRALWKSNMFYKNYWLADKFSNIIRCVRYCNTSNQFFVLANKGKDTHIWLDTLLCGTALCMATCQKDATQKTVSKVKNMYDIVKGKLIGKADI